MNHPLDLAQLKPGFAEPVHQSQSCFRSVLEALSRPGRIMQQSNLPIPPRGLGKLQAAILLALADSDTPVWLPPDLREAEAAHYLRFHSGCPLTSDLKQAHFVVLTSLADLPEPASLRLGEPAFPDRSATLLVEVPSLSAGGSLTLRGPGIETTHSLEVGGWSESCMAFHAANLSYFPLGVDLLLCCDDRLAGLPRTTRIAQARNTIHAAPEA